MKKPNLIRRIIQNKKIVFGTIVVGLIIFVSMLASIIAPYALEYSDLTQRLCPPSMKHLLGCDSNGGDVLTSILHGGRVSLSIAFITVSISLIIGVVIGLVSGYFGGIIDQVMMRFVDVTLAFPGILLALAILAVIGQSYFTIIITLVLTGWTAPARITRGEVLRLKSSEYIDACHTIGISHLKIMFKHLLPGALGPLIVHSTFSISGIIIVESSLSFLGLGPQGSPTWGALLSDGKSVLDSAPFLSIAPGVAIMLSILGLNFLGDGLRDVLDPKSEIR